MTWWPADFGDNVKEKTESSLGTATRADSPQPTVHAATPLPWRCVGRAMENCLMSGFRQVWGAAPAPVAYVHSEVDARLIVTAVNHYAEMLALLKEAAKYNTDKDGALWREIRALVQRIEDSQ